MKTIVEYGREYEMRAIELTSVKNIAGFGIYARGICPFCGNDHLVVPVRAKKMCVIYCGVCMGKISPHGIYVDGEVRYCRSSVPLDSK